MLTAILIAAALSAFLSVAASPFASKADALKRENFLPNGRPQTITMRNAAGESAVVSYDVDTIAEWKAKGFNAIAPAEQTAIDTAAANAVKNAPAVSAAQAAQAAADDADWLVAKAQLLAAFRADRAANAAADAKALAAHQ